MKSITIAGASVGRGREWAALLGYLSAVILLTALGYTLFVYLVLRALPGAPALGIAFVAVVAGIGSFFNPCAFPVLPAYLAQFSQAAAVPAPRRRLSVLVSGLSAAAGVITFNILLGAAIGVLGASFGASLGLAGPEPSLAIRWFRGIIGVLLILLGISHATGKGIRFTGLGHWVPRRPSSESVVRNFFGYGFFYPLIGISCGGPILAGLTLAAIASGGFTTAFGAFLLYSLVMALLMVVVSLLVSRSRAHLLRAVGGSVLLVKKLSGMFLLFAGGVLLLSAVFVRTFTRLLFP